VSGALKRTTGHILNISFTSKRNSIREVSRRGRERPELFVNIRYFIHSISLPRRRERGNEMHVWVCVWHARPCWRDCHFRVSFAQELISYRLDFPRRVLEVASIEWPIEMVEILLDHILLTFLFLSVCFLAGGKYLAHILYTHNMLLLLLMLLHWYHYCHYLNALCSLIFRNYIPLATMTLQWSIQRFSYFIIK